MPGDTMQRYKTLLVAIASLTLFASLPAFGQGIERRAPSEVDGDESRPDVSQRSNAEAAQSSSDATPWLGVRIAQDEKAENAPGIPVSQVIKQSPAALADIQKGDRITKVGDQRVGSLDSLREALTAYKVGEDVTITIVRDGETRAKNVVLSGTPSGQELLDAQLKGATPTGYEVESIGDENETIDSEKLRGKPAVVEFWATWCPPCRITSKRLEKLRERFGDDLNVVAISSESQNTLQSYVEENNPSYTVARDAKEAAHEAFFVSSYPTIAVLNADGEVVGVSAGVVPLEQLVEWVEKARE